jgi:bacteriocin biosynthesis cyclodehydratase domain-containing protein
MLADGAEPNGRNNHQSAYWSVHGTAAAEAASRFKRAHVVVADLGGVGTTVARALATAGVGTITGIDHRLVRTCDQGFGYAAQDVGMPRASAVAAVVRAESETRFIPVRERVQDLSNWDDIVAEADLVVACSDGMSLGTYEPTNEACLRQKKRWVSARIDRSRGLIGPFVIPGQSACFTCYELRSRANAEHPQDHAALYRHWKSSDDVAPDWPIMLPFAGVVGNYLALDIERVLAGNQLSMFMGRVFHLDGQTFESRYHEVLKLPRCPACSRERERPMTRIWDIRTAVPGE